MAVTINDHHMLLPTLQPAATTTAITYTIATITQWFAIVDMVRRIGASACLFVPVNPQRKLLIAFFLNVFFLMGLKEIDPFFDQATNILQYTCNW